VTQEVSSVTGQVNHQTGAMTWVGTPPTGVVALIKIKKYLPCTPTYSNTSTVMICLKSAKKVTVSGSVFSPTHVDTAASPNAHLKVCASLSMTCHQCAATP
jgi:hypothetical protein